MDCFVADAPRNDGWLSALTSPKSLSPPFDQLGADLLRLFLLGPMPAATDQIFLQIRHDLFHAVGGRRWQYGVVLRHDHQRGHAYGMIQSGSALPVTGEVAIPVDSAGEAGLGKGVDEHLLFLRRQDRRARIVFGVVAGDHLWKCQVQPGRCADARGGRLRRSGIGARHRLAHEGIEGLLHAAVENLIGFARRILKLHDVHVLAKALAQQFDRIRRRAVEVRRIDSDHAGHTIGMSHRHLPDDKSAPVVSDEYRLVDLQIIEQTDEIAGQVLEVVGCDRLRLVARAITTLIRRDHPNTRLAQRFDLMTPGKRDLRPAVAENERWFVGLRAGLVEAHPNPVGLRKLQRRHLDHRYCPYSAAPLTLASGGTKAASSAANSSGTMSQRTWTWGMMLAPAIKPKSS